MALKYVLITTSTKYKPFQCPLMPITNVTLLINKTLCRDYLSITDSKQYIEYRVMTNDFHALKVDF
jgi:hypothetical protein